MGVYYYVVSDESTREMVENENFEEIDKYVANPKPFVGPADRIRRAMGLELQQAKSEFAWIEGAYQIASRAVELGKEAVLRHVGEKICFDIYPRDGNSYDLFVLATEKHQFHMIDVLWQIACENGYQTIAAQQLEYASRRLLGYSHIDDDQEILRHLPLYVDKPGVSLWDVYHFSIAWHHPDILQWLIDTHEDRIDPNWTRPALKVAKGFDYKKYVALVKDNATIRKHLFEKRDESAQPTADVDTGCKHPLELTDFSKGAYRWGWECDECDESFPKGTERWSCKICQKDLCVACFKQPQVVPPPQQQAQPPLSE